MALCRIGMAPSVCLLAALAAGGSAGACAGEPASQATPDSGGAADAPTEAASDAGGVGFDWNLPPGFPVPLVPSDNPMTKEKVALGRYLFYDERLSGNRTQSCASCHAQERAFTDGRAQGLGSTGVLHPRSPMSLANVAYATTLSWANPLQVSLERQAELPLFGQDPVELGMASTPEVEARVRAEPLYLDLFNQAFPGEPISLRNLLRALASFERTLVSGRSPFDRWLQLKDESAISESAKRGYVLFNSEKFECFHCHVGVLFTDHVGWVGRPSSGRAYHNTGLYNIDGLGGYPAPNTGVENVTRDPADMGRFKAPTLRNVAVTAPYMHDGSIATLEGVLEHYAAGGRTIVAGPNAGNGSKNPLKDPLIVPLDVTGQEKSDVVEFLRTLTDSNFLTDPTLSDPWPR